MRWLRALLLLGCLAAAAQAASDLPPGLEQRVFRIEHRGVEEAYMAIAELLGPRNEVTVSKSRGSLVVLDEPERLESIAAVIERFDVPPGAVRLSLRLVWAETKEDAPRETLPGVPADLSQFAKDYTFEELGTVELVVGEEEREAADLGESFHVQVDVGGIDRLGAKVEIRKISLQRVLTDADGSRRFRTLYEYRERLRTDQLHILGLSTPRRTRTLFVFLEATVVGGA